MTKLQHVPENSIVRLRDGRLARVGRSGQRGKAVLLFAGDGNAGTYRPLSDEVEIVEYAAMIARNRLDELAAEEARS